MDNSYSHAFMVDCQDMSQLIIAATPSHYSYGMLHFYSVNLTDFSTSGIYTQTQNSFSLSQQQYIFRDNVIYVYAGDIYGSNSGTGNTYKIDLNPGYKKGVVLKRNSSQNSVGNNAFDISVYADAETIYGARSDGSFAQGFATKTGKTYQAVIGIYNIGNTDTLLEVGNGTSNVSRSNAFEVYDTGVILAPSMDISEITNDKTLITKEYAEANYGSLSTSHVHYLQDYTVTIAGQTDFVVSGKIFSTADIFVNGVLSRNTEYSISDDGTDTTVSLNVGVNLNDWVQIKYIQ
jgi:hypothetical protein